MLLLPKDEVYEFMMGANRFGVQTFWTFDQLSDAMDGTVLPGTGTIYLVDIYLTGRSEEVRIAQLNEAFSRLPDPETINGDGIIPYLAIMETARARYDESTNSVKATISNALYSRLLALEYKATSTGYGVAFSASKQGYIKYYYGDDFIIERGIINDDYGYVQKLHLTDAKNAEGVPEQAIGFDTDVLGGYAGYRLAIFNPTASPVNLVVRNTNWTWDKDKPYFTEAILAPGVWSSINIKAELLQMSLDGKASIFLHNEEGVSLKGEWLFTSLYGLPYAV